MNTASWIVLFLVAVGCLWAARRILRGSGGCGGCTNESCTARKKGNSPSPIHFVRKGEKLPSGCPRGNTPKR